MTKNHNVPPYGQEPPETLVCFDCGEELSNDAQLAYWERNPYGDGEPRCLDCQSQIDPPELTIIHPPSHLLSKALLLLALGVLLSAGIFPEQAGYCVMGAIGLGNVGLIALVCRR